MYKLPAGHQSELVSGSGSTAHPEKANDKNYVFWREHMRNALVIEDYADCLRPFVPIEGETPAALAARRMKYDQDPAEH